MNRWQRAAALVALMAAALLGSGCTTAVVLMHVHAKLTEGDPAPCGQLNSVERALQARCGEFVAGSLREADIAASGLPACPLALAAREPRFWPLLPELLAGGARVEVCAESPLAVLAQSNACPDFTAAPVAVRDALRTLADSDPRAVQHDVVRLLSCPAARAAGLDAVLDGWFARGRFERAGLGFSPLSALHPGHLGSPLAARLEGAGHRARDAWMRHAGRLPDGFETALREADLVAIDWWLLRQPGLADEVPAVQAGQLPWRPLARVLTPSFQPDTNRQGRVVEHLLAHGADPWKTLPHERTTTVVAWAERLNSPFAARLAAPAPAPRRPVPALAVAVSQPVREF